MRLALRERLAGTPDRERLLSALRWSPLDEARRKGLEEDLRRILPPDRLLLRRGERLSYGYDATSERWLPDAVAFPLTTDEVVALMEIAVRWDLPVVARGAASGLSGGAVPLAGGLVVAFGRMNRLLTLDPERRVAVAQPGLVNRDLSEATAPHGLFY